MDEIEIKDVVRQVLKEVLKSQPKENSNSKRKLANENIARWLGRTEEKARFEIKPIKQTPPHEPKGNIPNPRKPEKLASLLEHTPARLGVWRAGTRYLTRVALKLRADHAVAKDAVYAELPDDLATQNGWVPLQTLAKTKEEFLLRPDLGRQLSVESLKLVQEKGIKNPDVQITVADGLSSWAAQRYAKPLVEELTSLLKAKGHSVGTIFCVKYSRIAIQDVIGETLNAKVSIILLGERPGLGSGDSLSNYMIYGPKVGALNARKSMISNIHTNGYSPQQAATLTFDMITKMIEQKTSGIDLKV